MSNIKIIDMNNSSNTKYLGGGKNYAITNIASLPSAFTEDFTSIAVTDGNTGTSAQKSFGDAMFGSVQVITTAITGGTATITVQKSNVGGTSADVWVDVATGTAVTTTGSIFIDIDASDCRDAAFYRVKVAASGGDVTCYLVGFGYANR